MEPNDKPIPDHRLNRRDFLSTVGIGATIAGIGGLSTASRLAKAAKFNHAPATSTTNPFFVLQMVPKQVQLLPGPPTDVLSWNHAVIEGSEDDLKKINNSYLGPTMRLTSGGTCRIEILNGLNEETVLHLHGLLVPEVMDGHPRYAIGPNMKDNYKFHVLNRAGTYWYHPHPDMRTGPQVYAGLAGMIIVTDDEEQNLALPRGEYDQPIIIQDRWFDENNQLQYYDGGITGMHGDVVMVNGIADYRLSAATRMYRFRILNGSNARQYKLKWSTDRVSMTVIGTDGGLIRRPIDMKYVFLGPGERVEILADFSRLKVGTELKLQSLPFFGAGVATNPNLPVGAAFDVMTVGIDRQETESLVRPKFLSQMPMYNPKQAVNFGNPRRFVITGSSGFHGFNDLTFEMLAVDPNETVRLNDLEIWEFENPDLGGRLVHPIHLHGPQFQVINRSFNAPGRLAGYLSTYFGYTDFGWKDTFMIWPGEKVQILVKHHTYPGLFLYHCHNLEHEDMGMMRNFLVQP